MVNLEWYRSFVEVYRIGTVSKAADVLHLTQPAVSQHVAALETALSVALFQRAPRRMVPTAAGKRLYSQVVAAVEALEAIPTKGSLAEAPLLIRLGSPAEFFTEYALPRLPNLSDVLLSVQFGLAPDLVEQLIADQIDVAIATQKIARPVLEYQLLFEESFWLVGPPETELPLDAPGREDLPAWLKCQPWIAYSEDLPIIRRFWRVAFGRRLEVNPQIVIPDLRSIRAAIANGLGYSVLPDYLCEAWVAERRMALVLKPKEAVTNKLWLAYRKKERQSQAVSLLSDWLSQQQ